MLIGLVRRREQPIYSWSWRSRGEVLGKGIRIYNMPTEAVQASSNEALR